MQLDDIDPKSSGALAELPTPLPATISVAEAAALIDVSTDLMYDSCARGEVDAIRVGRRVRVPLRPLMAACGLADEDARALQGLPDGGAEDEGAQAPAGQQQRQAARGQRPLPVAVPPALLGDQLALCARVHGFPVSSRLPWAAHPRHSGSRVVDNRASIAANVGSFSDSERGTRWLIGGRVAVVQPPHRAD